MSAIPFVIKRLCPKRNWLRDVSTFFSSRLIEWSARETCSSPSGVKSATPLESCPRCFACCASTLVTRDESGASPTNPKIPHMVFKSIRLWRLSLKVAISDSGVTSHRELSGVHVLVMRIHWFYGQSSAPHSAVFVHSLLSKAGFSVTTGTASLNLGPTPGGNDLGGWERVLWRKKRSS